MHAGDEVGTRMLCEIIQRMMHVVGLDVNGFESLSDASVVALAEHCPHLTTINFGNC